MSDRVACVVPGCRRGSTKLKPEHNEFICQPHWSATDRDVRKILFRARRRGKPRTEALCWRVLKRQAIERGAGI